MVLGECPAPNTYRGSIAIGRHKGDMDDDSEAIEIACDLENHRFPRTVPIKRRAQRLSVVQLDYGLGKGAERVFRHRGREFFREQHGHPINRWGSWKLSYDPIGGRGPHGDWALLGSLCQAVPSAAPVRRGAWPCSPSLRTEELVHVEGFFACEHVVDRPAEFMGQDR